MMAEKCKECGCKCKSCILSKEQHGDMHLHVEIENLKQRLVERDNHIVTMETQFLNEAEKFPNGELASMKEELSVWQEKYTRLHDAHKRVQKVNQNLEDKLLRIVDKCETEKSAFTKDIATLSHRLADANYTIHRLTQDNEKYRNDVNLAIQLLQCKPSNFVGQKYEALPSEVQAKVRTYIAQKKRSNDATPDVKSITVPISTFPPTAMVYNVTKPSVDKHSDDDTDEAKPPVDIVSAAIMAKVLEDREKERIFGKHCDTCTCHRSILMIDTETQTNSTDVSSSTECTVKYGQNMDKHNDNNLKDNENNSSHKESLNSMVHVTYHEINENLSNKVQYQSNCIKISNCQQFCAKEKLIGRNGKIIDTLKEEGRVSFNAKSTLNKKNSSRRNDSQYQCGIQNNNDETLKYTMSQNVNEAYSKVKPEKGKQTKLSKKCELQADGKYNGNSWNKYEKVSSNCNHVVLEKPKNHFVAKEQSHIDIINDRLWKNEWTKRKSQKNGNEDKEKVNSDIEIDVINDRVWKNDRSIQDARHPAQLTLIEVKNVDNGTHQNDAGQIEVATSPSFSSDSIVISTSDPSSSSSDVVQSIGTRLHNNGNNAKVSVQHRISGPRNCLVRVTPGSKNILLDNAGHYKTVLYTSGSNKPDTALVHSKKLSRSESERSISTSSEESSPMLLHENHQLQRVAEWVQSSVHMDNSGVNYTELKSKQNIMDKSPSLLYLNEPQMKFKTEEKTREKIQKRSDDFEENKTKDAEKNSSVYVNDNETGKDKDLISFDVPIEEEKALPKCFKKCDSVDLNYEVKITKEMEETYLKLAASLDPVALSLSSTDNTDITIEKYRKDHKKLQKSHDKMGSKV